MDEFLIEQIGPDLWAVFNLFGFIVGIYTSYDEADTALAYEFAA